MGKKEKLKKNPLVTVCTPTFNRRPFIPIMIKCFEHQNYPKDKIEWIIIDDGTDKIEDLVKHIPQVKYLKYDEKLTIGQKRNIGNDNAKGEIIVYMDDDDYYPPERISHAVDTLRQNPKALCAGSSILHIHFKHISKMYQFGPYGPNHATAATFAFRKTLLTQTRFDEKSSLAEEKMFLKNYTIPFAQLDSKKTILVFSHNHNSFDKKELLKQLPNPTVSETVLQPCDFVKQPELLKFFMEDIDTLLEGYELGKPENKPDVTKQMLKMKETREKAMAEDFLKKMEYLNTITKIQTLATSQQPVKAKADNKSQVKIDNTIQLKIDTLSQTIQELTLENKNLKDHINFLHLKLFNSLEKTMEEVKQPEIVQPEIVQNEA